MMQDSSKRFNTESLGVALGITLRQMQWWDETGVIQAHHLGHKRFWSESEVLKLVVMKHLRDRGVSLQKARKIIHPLTEACADRSRNQYNYAVCQQSTILFVRTAEHAIEKSEEAGRSVLIISLDKLRVYSDVALEKVDPL